MSDYRFSSLKEAAIHGAAMGTAIGIITILIVLVLVWSGYKP